MSATRKEIIEQLDAAEKSVAEREAKIAELTAAVETLKTDRVADVEKLKADLAASGETVKALGEQLEAAVKNVAALKAECAEHARKVDIAAKALADPKLLDAAMAEFGLGKTLQAAADAEADRAEALAKAPEKTVLQSWQEITDPGDKRAFYLAHKDEIKAELKKQEA